MSWFKLYKNLSGTTTLDEMEIMEGNPLILDLTGDTINDEQTTDEY